MCVGAEGSGMNNRNKEGLGETVRSESSLYHRGSWR